MTKIKSRVLAGVFICTPLVAAIQTATAAPLPGGTLDPLTIPKYVSPLVIPPVMKDAAGGNSTNDYDIAVRQFKQQILPAPLPPTTVWSYGPAGDPVPTGGVAPAANSQFNYPAYTIEAKSGMPITVDWINDLVERDANGDPTGNWLPHLLSVDQTLHWANPGAQCDGIEARTDCRGSSATPYAGPVPIVTHVHGAHVQPDSDGYPEAWWLPDAAAGGFDCVDAADADPAADKYVCQGTLTNQYGTPNTANGVAAFSYPNDQPSTTLWYHDHTLGMTRNNVYAGPAGFWLIRDPDGVNGETGLGADMVLPGPAPLAGQTVLELNVPTNPVRQGVREIPVVIQDRSFNADGSLFYPTARAFFEGLPDDNTTLPIPFIGDPNGQTATLPSGIVVPADSDISPIWNPEAFFNVMVVNGVSWPQLEVAPAIYRLRLLNGSNSRFLNLAMFEVNPGGELVTSAEHPFYQIGAEQSTLPQVVEIQTGFATSMVTGDPLPVKNQGKNPGNAPPKQAAAHKDQALLMGLAERADVLVDFRGLENGTVIRMINTAPDAPFGGFPDVAADPDTSGQIMQFVVNTALNGASPTDPAGATPATAPNMLALTPVEDVDTYPTAIGATEALALLEEESMVVCAAVSPSGLVTYIDLGNQTFDPLDPANICFAAGGVPWAPMAAVLGTGDALTATPQLWSDPITSNPLSGATEQWDLTNVSADAHPIHLHLVKFKVLGRTAIGGGPGLVPGNGVQPWETGWKDTVIAYPGEVTSVAATFDIDGLYVWHCHIVEHEDNEMMVPFCVGDQATASGCNATNPYTGI